MAVYEKFHFEKKNLITKIDHTYSQHSYKHVSEKKSARAVNFLKSGARATFFRACQQRAKKLA